MLAQIASMPIFGAPAIMYGGLTVFALIIIQLVMGHRIMTGKCKLKNPLKWHKAIAWLLLLVGFFHGLLGMAIIFKF